MTTTYRNTMTNGEAKEWLKDIKKLVGQHPQWVSGCGYRTQDDVVQEIIMEVLRAKPHDPAKSARGTYLYLIAVRKCWKLWEKAKKEKKTTYTDPPEMMMEDNHHCGDAYSDTIDYDEFFSSLEDDEKAWWESNLGAGYPKLPQPGGKSNNVGNTPRGRIGAKWRAWVAEGQ